jgi:hypothetical protein
MSKRQIMLDFFLMFCTKISFQVFHQILTKTLMEIYVFFAVGVSAGDGLDGNSSFGSANGKTGVYILNQLHALFV